MMPALTKYKTALTQGLPAAAVRGAIAGLEADGSVAPGTDLGALSSVVSWKMLYGSTAGPFGGVGGAAMTRFTMTVSTRTP
jgi:hypothetical protein